MELYDFTTVGKTYMKELYKSKIMILTGLADHSTCCLTGRLNETK